MFKKSNKRDFFSVKKNFIVIFAVLITFLSILHISPKAHAEEVGGVIHGPGASATRFVPVTREQEQENGGVEGTYYRIVPSSQDSKKFERQEYLKFKNGKVGFNGWPDENEEGKVYYWRQDGPNQFKVEYNYDDDDGDLVSIEYSAQTDANGRVLNLQRIHNNAIAGQPVGLQSREEQKFVFDSQGNFINSTKEETYNRSNGYEFDNPELAKRVENRVRSTNEGECKLSDLWNCIEQIFYYILAMVAWILGLAVWLFDTVFEFTVIFMSETVNGIGAIKSVWKVFRDLTNITLIFILLFLAISTIIGKNEHGIKHTLSKLIFVAILINFSMFFAKVVVDSSNILAISFYKKIQPAEKSPDVLDLFKRTYDGPSNVGGVAGAFMASFQFQKLFSDYQKGDRNGPVGGGDVARNFASKDNAGTIFLMGSITMFFVFCIFLAATLIFIKRLVTIIVLIMTSSLAFGAMLLHKTEGIAHQWWEKLLAEAFYAPVFVAVIWMALHVMLDSEFQKTLNSANSDFFFNIPTVVNYIIVINFFIMALVAGEKMGASGAGAAMGAYKKLKSNIGGRAVQAGVRSTIGKAAYALYEGKDKHGVVGHGWRGSFKTGMEKMISKGGIMGAGAGAVKSMLKAGVEAKVGPGNSFKEEFSEKQHAMAEALFELRGNPADQAKFLAEMTLKAEKDLNVRVALEKTIEGMKLDEQAEMTEQFDEKINALQLKKEKNGGELSSKEEKELKDYEKAKDKFMSRLDTNQQDALSRKREGSLPIHREKYKKLEDNMKNTQEYIDIHGGSITDDHGKVLTDANGKPLTVDKKESLTAKRDAEAAKLDELRRTGGSEAKIAEAAAKVADFDLKIKEKNDKLSNSSNAVELRKFFNSLNTKQQEGLSREQLLNPVVSGLIQGNLFEQLQRSNKLNGQDYDRLGKVMDAQIERMQRYAEAANGDDESKGKFLNEINTHLKSIGQTAIVDSKEGREYALKYYEEHMLPKDTPTGHVSKNMSRFYATELGAEEGEKAAKKAITAKRDRRAGVVNPAVTPAPQPIPPAPQPPAPQPIPPRQHNPATDPFQSNMNIVPPPIPTPPNVNPPPIP
jgi:hypothetical protein